MLGYDPHPGQVAVHRSKAPRRVLACGVRWGKSTAGAMEAIAALMAPNEGSLGWLCAPTYDLTNRIYKRVVETVKQRLGHRIVAEIPREHRILVLNITGGVSELRAKTADNPASLLGEGLDWLIVDEASHLKPEVWEMYLSQRLVDRNGWALLLSTPRGRNWFYQLYRRGQRGRDPSVESWRSPSCDNPHLKPELIERERVALPPATFAESYLAEFTGEDMEPCDTCGGPSPTAPRVVLWEHKERPEPCSDCGGLIGKDGRTLVHLDSSGNRVAYLIRTYEGRVMRERAAPQIPG